MSLLLSHRHRHHQYHLFAQYRTNITNIEQCTHRVGWDSKATKVALKTARETKRNLNFARDSIL